MVFITGASGSIGRETACKFAGEKMKLIVTYNRNKSKGEETYKKCQSLGASDVLLLQLDLANNRSINHAVNGAVKKFKKIDILINNAGVVAWSPLKDQSLADIEKQIRINLEGLIKMTKIFLPHIKDMIINVGSGAGKTGFADLSTYCASKFGVRGFTQALAEEVEHIKVYAVNPDMTATKMTDFQGRPPEQVAEVILKTAKGEYRARSGSDIDVWERYK